MVSLVPKIQFGLSRVCVRLWVAALMCSLFSLPAVSQTTKTASVKRGSETAKNGFRNEADVAAKLLNWRNDAEGSNWLSAMGYPIDEVEAVVASRPHGEKADVVAVIRTAAGEFEERISIKLVSSISGFNQIDKRWLSAYARMWKMPDDVRTSLSLFVGEKPPVGRSRRPERMFLNELPKEEQAKVIDFFSANKEAIISDLIAGDGATDAEWLLVIWKPADRPRWTLRNVQDVARFYAEGDVEITRAGNLKIGRITMQRKGGDGGRETAKMLQFKMNPALLFNAK